MKTKALEILKEHLIGNTLTRFSVGDTFDLQFSRYWLVAHNIVSPDEEYLNEKLSGYPLLQSSVDHEDVSKLAILAALKRKKVTNVAINDNSSLTIVFEDGYQLMVPTDTGIVDWQWCLNLSGSEPYIDYCVACFSAGEVMVNL